MDDTFPSLRSPELTSRTSSRLLLVDMQTKLVPALWESERVVAACRLLLSGAKILGIPITVTEQYPQGLGPTIPALAEIAPAPIAKQRFSCAECLDWPEVTIDTPQYQVVVAGIETHVCVLQTALDLLARGYQVFVAVDASSSRRELDWQIGRERLANAGAVITTSESVLFEWCEVSGTAEFKAISGLIKAAAAT